MDEEDVNLVESQTSGMVVHGPLNPLFSPSVNHAVNTVTSPDTRSPYDCATVPTQFLKKDELVEATTGLADTLGAI